MTKQPMKPFGKLSKGKMKIQHIANLNVDFKYLIPNVKLVGIGPQDIYDGNQRLILGLIWSIICFFTLQEFQEMMENLEITEGQQGQGSSEGQQAMEGLADTLRQQQGLSDQAFRDLQEQYNPGAGAGQSFSMRVLQ